MKKLFLIGLFFLVKLGYGQTSNYWEGSVTFPDNYQVGDYREFVGVAPIGAGASGNYEISICYTRGNIAAAATYLASITHSNPDIWRELGRVNSNGYVTPGSENHNFTVDCNTEYANPRFRIRAINTYGVTSQPLLVYIKVRSINFNASWTTVSTIGNDLTVSKFLPMTNDWSLYVGNTVTTEGASIAIRALENGNVGIGTTTPAEKLSVNGKIRAQEIKVENTNWPDYVFTKDYQLSTLQETENHIKEKGHLPGIPSAAEVKANGIDLGEMNTKLLQKIEELTLHLIEMKKENMNLSKRVNQLENKK
ncbi:hypothetical protein [Pedobacter heparinus]|uniref:hypothetical protein n=1 Tax=Pedobacter heparinus TaxID=984 RepID=UPI002930EF02|nr:hypothetical protein [Pedobacter heparinus]